MYTIIRGSKTFDFQNDIPWIPDSTGIRRWLSFMQLYTMKKGDYERWQRLI